MKAALVCQTGTVTSRSHRNIRVGHGGKGGGFCLHFKGSFYFYLCYYMILSTHTRRNKKAKTEYILSM